MFLKIDFQKYNHEEKCYVFKIKDSCKKLPIVKVYMDEVIEWCKNCSPIALIAIYTAYSSKKIGCFQPIIRFLSEHKNEMPYLLFCIKEIDRVLKTNFYKKSKIEFIMSDFFIRSCEKII